MTLLYNNEEHPVRVLLNPGSSIPVISFHKARVWKLPIIKRPRIRTIMGFNSVVDTIGGRYYTEAVVLRHQEDHYTRLNFELSTMDDQCDIILPHWWLQQHEPAYFFDKTQEIKFASDYCQKNCTSTLVLGLPPTEAIASIQNKVDAAIAAVPEKFREFLPIMSKEAAIRMPDHQPWDHKIDLKKGETPPHGPLFAMSGRELDALKPWLEKMLNSGRIRKSTSSCSAPLMFVDKKDPGDPLRPVVDYRVLNRMTVPVRHPIPLITELPHALRTAKIFSKIDLKSGFFLVRMAKGHEWKTAFRCKYDLFEYIVMPMGLINAPSTFQAMMNHLFMDLLDAGVLVYLDDILIYADTEEEHDRLVLEVLKRLTDNHLAVAPQKCKWGVTEVEFLGYIISPQGIGMAEDKVKSILEWKQPTTLKESQSFLGFTNFYRRFIKGFSTIAQALSKGNSLDKKLWRWTEPMAKAFKDLKEAFTTAPVLAHFDPAEPAVMETDASDFGIGAILS